MTLYLFKHSNYYNRILKRYDTLLEYFDNSIYIDDYSGINFKPYDGVQTSLILNHQGETPDYIICVNDDNTINSRWYVIEDERLLNGLYRYTLLRDVIADYYSDVVNAPCFVEKALLPPSNTLIFNEENMLFNKIKELEFFIKDKSECRWIVGYVARDAEHSGEIEADSGVYDAALDLNATLITLSQFEILTSGKNYYQKDTSIYGAIPTIRFPVEFIVNNNYYYQYVVNLVVYDESWLNIPQYTPTDPNSDFNYADHLYYGSFDTCYRKFWDGIGFVIDPDFVGGSFEDDEYWTFPSLGKLNLLEALKFTGKNNNIKSMILDILGPENMNISTISLSTVTDLSDLEGKILKYGDKYFKFTHYSTSARDLGKQYIFDEKGNAGIELASTILNTYVNALTKAFEDSVLTIDINNMVADRERSIHGATDLNENAQSMRVVMNDDAIVHTYKLEEVDSDYTITLSPKITRNHNDSGIYDMFTMPYDNIRSYIPFADPYIDEEGTSHAAQYVEIEKDECNYNIISMSVASAIATALGGGGAESKIYDLLILPFCPCSEYIRVTSTGPILDLRKAGVANVNRVLTGNTTVAPLIWCRSSQDNFPIDCDNINNLPEYFKVSPTNPLTKKVNAATKTYRLCSPGYTSIFEFNSDFNGGVSHFQVQYLYQPYNPYIRIAPEFKNLYGIDSIYDSKGLVLKGDFSIPIIGDRWAQYQINNKYYDEILNRSILSLELQNSILRKLEIVQAITGTISGAVSGATSGAIASGGNPIGAAAGAVAGGAASAVGGVLDVKYGDMLRAEALDYKRDMYGYNLATILALPDTLSKSSPLSPNNSVWPILEEYDATKYEREAFRKKLIYNGMSVGVIDNLFNYLNYRNWYNENEVPYMYFKGKLVRLETIFADSHIVNAISNELNRGIYL